MNITKIYLVENCYGDPNKVYIGKTTSTRKNPHKRTYGKNIIYNEIDEISSLKREDWGPLESFWIEQFRQFGFEIQNPNKKGGGGPEFQTEETKRKIHLNSTGIKRHTNHSKSLIGKANRNKRNRSIFQYDLDGNFIKKYKSIKSANKSLGLSPYDSNISSCCRGVIKTSRNYIWRYKYDSKLNSYIDPEIKLKNLKAYQFCKGGKLIKEWNNVYEASQYLHLNVGNIINCCHKTNKSTGGCFWRFSKENLTKDEIKHQGSLSILQYDLDGNFIQEFSSILEASFHYINSKKWDSGISKCCKGILKKSHGYIWKYKE